MDSAVGLELVRDLAGSGWDVIHLPFDGPAEVLGLAVAGLLARLRDAHPAAVALDSDPPPAPVDLARISSIVTPAIDLVGVDWASRDRVWLTGPDGIASVRHDVTDHESSVELAAAVLSLGLMVATDPAGQWVKDVAQRRTVPSLALWCEVLCAAYVEAVSQATRGPTIHVHGADKDAKPRG